MPLEPPRIPKEEVKRRLDSGEEIAFLDVRSPDAWDASERQLPHSIRLLGSEVENHLREVPQDEPVIAYCT